MNLQAIQAFVKVVERGSFAAVARHDRVAPSSISRLVAELEDELGVRLFQRTTRTLSLTEAGEAYLARVGPVLEELELARLTARELGTRPRGTLRIACSNTFAQIHLAQWLPPFLSRYPDLDVDLALGSPYTDLVGDRIDVALRIGHVDGASLVARKLCEMPRLIVASPKLLAGRAMKPDDVAREPCLLFSHEGVAPVWRFRDSRARVREVRPRGRVVAADGIALKNLAIEGEGFALLTRWICAKEIAAGDLVDVFPRYDVTATEFDAGVFIVYPSRTYLPLKVRVFVDFVVALFRGGPPWERAASRLTNEIHRAEVLDERL